MTVNRIGPAKESTENPPQSFDRKKDRQIETWRSSVPHEQQQRTDFLRERNELMVVAMISKH